MCLGVMLAAMMFSFALRLAFSFSFDALRLGVFLAAFLFR